MKTIILVENDPVVIKVYGSEFELEGFGVEVAPDGLVALKMLTAVRPDVVVLDLMMPKLNGVDVLKYIRSVPDLKATRVILLSNAHKTSVEQAAAEFGVEKALLKSSCTPGQLLEVINELLSGGKPVESDPAKRMATPAPPTKPQTGAK